MIVSWWNDACELPPLRTLMSEESTFILEIDAVPALSLTVFLTNNKTLSYVDGFIKSPSFKNRKLTTASTILWNHAFKFAKQRGYRWMIGFARNKLADYYINNFDMNNLGREFTAIGKEL